MIGIIDYGSGNLKSVYNALRYIGQDVRICVSPEDLGKADKVIFPGVGSSRDAMNGLSSRGLDTAIMDGINKGKPFLGICLGLQLLFDESEESGGTEGLGLIKGAVKLFPYEKGFKVPQIGWNTVELKKEDCPLFKGIKSGTYFYFVHSYYCESGENECVAGVTEYSRTYTSAVWKDNVFAVQFHPERSQEKGLQLLRNFTEL
ncbi:MAG: imidazole glycerol phosphate synthase subunit HisH [Candidatus Omnitrophota bacterium]